MSDRKVIWQPQPGSQRIFLALDVEEVLIEGTRGGGKTDTLLMDFAQYVDRGFGANWRGILFRQTYKQLSDVIAKSKKWFHQIFPDAKFNASEHYWHWPSGEQLLLRSFQRPDDYWNYHGHEYPWIGWEELANWSDPGGYLRMRSCNRSSHPGLPRRYRSTTNPYGPGHNWIKHRWRLPAFRNKLITDSYDDDGNLEAPRASLHSSIHENKVLLEADPKYVERLRSSARNEAELRAWLYGDWDIVAGGMFDDVWSYQHNVVTPFDIPQSWRIDRSFDWGSSKPFSVGWWAESDGTDLRMRDGTVRSTVRGDLFRIAEWYGWAGKPNEGCRMLAVEIAKGIVEREVKWHIHDRVKPGPADNSIFDVQNGTSIALDMARGVRLADGQIYKGIGWTRSDKTSGSRMIGWEMMRKMLAATKAPEGMVRENPGLFVCSNCEHFIRTVPVLPRDDRNPDDVDTDAEDHVADEVRYRVRATSQKFSSGRSVGLY